MEQQKYKGHTPAKNHPWKTTGIVKKEVAEWARESSTNPLVANYKKGGGLPQK